MAEEPNEGHEELLHALARGAGSTLVLHTDDSKGG